MLLLLVIPVLMIVGAVQRYLAMCAPSNILIRRVRNSPARLQTAVMLAALGSALLVAIDTVHLRISAGAPSWLNLIVLVLAWDAAKISALAVVITCRWATCTVRRRVCSARVAKAHQTGITLG